MNPTLPTAVADFFNGSMAGDPEVWVSPFTDEAQIHDPVGQPPLTGRAALRERMAGFLPYLAKFSGLVPTDAYQAGDSVAVHWTATATTTAGRDLAWSGVTVFSLDTSGRIHEMRAYFDHTIFA